MKKLQILLFIPLLVFLMAACSGGSSNKTDAEQESNTSSQADASNENGQDIEINNPADLSNAIADAMKQFNNGKEVEAIDFRELKALLPERLAGMERTSIEGEKTGMGGFKYSVAKASYEAGDAKIEISIVDGAGFAGVVTGMAAWSLVEVDRETDNGYERTTTINGHKAFETYDSKRKEGQISVIVEDRFIVNIEGDRIASDKDLKRAFDALNLDKLKKAS